MHTKITHRTVGIRRAVCLVLTAVLLLVPFASAAVYEADAVVTITKSINLTNPRMNMTGAGYAWMNLDKTLTLDGLYIDTSDEYGMRIPDGATVILKGNNYIRAASYAMGIPGNVTFKGNGTLTLVGGDAGLYFYSTDDTTIARIMGGNFKITAGGVGIRSEYTTLSVTKGTFDIDVPAKDGVAILGRTLKLHGGKFTAQGPITASQNLEIRAANLSVAADRAALSANRKLTLKDVSLSVGDTADDLRKADSYNGENCIRVKSAANLLGESVLFGEAVPMFADILVIVALAALVAAGIGLPLLRAHRRSKRALAAAAEAEKK
ncbi:MAG: carbohydrate-binding domain-containing protein [Clostridia bacterium]|nr:carbohydrate-binding domain-containing protein [Clostridia bacterium]